MAKNFRLFNPPAMARPIGYSHVAEVTSGRTIYIAGQVAFDRDGKLIGAGDMKAQAEQVFLNLKAALESVGAGFEHVVKFSIYTVDISQIQAVRDARDKYINVENPPTSTAVEVRKLFRDDVLLEIEAVAVVPE